MGSLQQSPLQLPWNGWQCSAVLLRLRPFAALKTSAY